MVPVAFIKTGNFRGEFSVLCPRKKLITAILCNWAPKCNREIERKIGEIEKQSAIEINTGKYVWFSDKL